MNSNLLSISMELNDFYANQTVKILGDHKKDCDEKISYEVAKNTANFRDKTKMILYRNHP